MGRSDSDEAYVLDLCDIVLDEHGLRQHRFDWLRGDPGTHGRRDTLIPAHGLRLIVIRPSDLDSSKQGRLRRHRDIDLTTMRKLLAGAASDHHG